MRWSWRLWPPVPWGSPERSRFRPGIAYTSRMIACRHDGTRDQLEALAALECPRCPGQPLAPYGQDERRLRICECCPRIYQMPGDPRDFLADLDEPQYELVEKPAREQPKYPPTEEPAMTYHPPEPTDEAVEVAPQTEGVSAWSLRLGALPGWPPVVSGGWQVYPGPDESPRHRVHLYRHGGSGVIGPDGFVPDDGFEAPEVFKVRVYLPDGDLPSRLCKRQTFYLDADGFRQLAGEVDETRKARARITHPPEPEPAAEWTGAPGEGRARFGCEPEPPAKAKPRTLTLNCPRCGAEVEFRVDSADVTIAAQTVAGRVHLLRADVDLTGGHTCEVGA